MLVSKYNKFFYIQKNTVAIKLPSVNTRINYGTGVRVRITKEYSAVIISCKCDNGMYYVLIIKILRKLLP